MDYNLMTNQELQELSLQLSNDYSEYQNILKEAYSNMEDVAKKYDEIQNILKKRNVNE
jgi:hypothetical protein